MKRTITIVIILAFIISLSFWGIYRISCINQDMNSALDEIVTEVQYQQYEQAEEKATAIVKQWETISKTLETYIKHDLVDKISMNLARLQILIENNDNQEIFIEIQETRCNLQSLYENELPLIRNIF